MFEINERTMQAAAEKVGAILRDYSGETTEIDIHTVTLQIDGAPGVVRMKVEANDAEFGDDVNFEVTL